MGASNHPGLFFPKIVKVKRGPSEASVLAKVRIQCRKRDDPCAVLRLPPVDLSALIQCFGSCRGPSQLAHLYGKRQSATRRMRPEQRHDSKWTARLCYHHHIAEEHKGLRFVPSTADGMNGSFSWAVSAPKTLRTA